MNKAAEHLVRWLAEHGQSEGDMRSAMDDALIAEREATVERIRAEVVRRWTPQYRSEFFGVVIDIINEEAER